MRSIDILISNHATPLLEAIAPLVVKTFRIRGSAQNIASVIDRLLRSVYEQIPNHNKSIYSSHRRRLLSLANDHFNASCHRFINNVIVYSFRLSSSHIARLVSLSIFFWLHIFVVRAYCWKPEEATTRLSDCCFLCLYSSLY